MSCFIDICLRLKHDAGDVHSCLFGVITRSKDEGMSIRTEVLIPEYIDLICSVHVHMFSRDTCTVTPLVYLFVFVLCECYVR